MYDILCGNFIVLYHLFDQMNKKFIRMKKRYGEKWRTFYHDEFEQTAIFALNNPAYDISAEIEALISEI